MDKSLVWAKLLIRISKISNIVITTKTINKLKKKLWEQVSNKMTMKPNKAQSDNQHWDKAQC
jgi:hypothetical protein